VSQNDNFLILLGNDILSDNKCYEFLGIDKVGSSGILKFRDPANCVVVECEAQIGNNTNKAECNFVEGGLVLTPPK
jgi:hypothetical protein